MNENESLEIPNCRDILTQLGPLDTLLGSVSYNEIDNVDGKTQQLRTSARVFKKMKFDLSNSISQDKKLEKKEEPKPEDIKIEIKKPSNPLWTLEEKCIFFEALNEHGKDFESMHAYISTRLKKKGVPEDAIKNKHQIRHFYYKTYHMILNYLKFPDKIPKNALELYALINYGEIRRKIGSVSKKNWNKLNELIQHGSSSVRVKGKTIKVKTPMCRALRRLNQLDEKYDDLKLPTRVIVELKPKDMVSFLKVQSMAQNPRIKVALSLQKRLSSLLTCINQRWKSAEAIVYDKASISINPNTKDCVPDQKVIEANALLLTPLLRLTPPFNAHVELPSIDISEYFTGQSICLNAFEIRRGVKMKDEIKKEEPESSTSKVENVSTTNQQNGDNLDTESINVPVETTPATVLTPQIQDSQSKCDNNKNTVFNTKPKIKEITPEERRARIEQIRQGWTVENCGCLTVGEIYLMFGSDSKLFLEYSWDSSHIKSKVEEDKEDVIEQQENNLTTSLKKLLSIAKLKLDCTSTVMKCSCGHVCGAKSNAAFKKPATTKVIRKNQVLQENVVEENIDDCDANSRFIVEPRIGQTEEQSLHDANLSMANLLNQRDTIQRLNPRIRARGRGRYKQLVVERKLVPNKSENKHQIVSMNIVSQENKPDEDVVVRDEPRGLLRSSGISSLLGDTDNKLPESTTNEESFSDLLADNRSNSVMSAGISKILKENENQWINSEVTDYSLSSLLGHLDCQSKTNQSMVSINHDDSVDAQVRNLLIESSVDYTAQFADLAAQVVDNKKINDQL